MKTEKVVIAMKNTKEGDMKRRNKANFIIHSSPSFDAKQSQPSVNKSEGKCTLSLFYNNNNVIIFSLL